MIDRSIDRSMQFGGKGVAKKSSGLFSRPSPRPSLEGPRHHHRPQQHQEPKAARQAAFTARPGVVRALL